MNLYHLKPQLANIQELCVLPPKPYIHPPLGTAFSGVVVAAGCGSPDGVFGSAKPLVNHLEMMFISIDFGGVHQSLSGQGWAQLRPMSISARGTRLGQHKMPH